MADGRNSSRQGDRTSPKYQAKKAASERVAAARAAQVRAARKRSIMYAGGIGGIVVIIIAVIVIVGVSHKTAKSAAYPVLPATAAVTSGLASTAAMTTSAPVLSTIVGPPKKLTNSTAPASSDGKPDVLYVGAEYCPHCAITRWPLAVALSRFGSFTNLQTTYSEKSDDPASVPTLSFRGSTYTSDYIHFDGIEYQDGAGKVVGKLTTDQSKLFESIGSGGYPFIDFGGNWAQIGQSIDPSAVSGLTPDQVAAKMSDRTNAVGSEIQSSADIFTAAICQMDGGKPANVCTATGVADATASLNAIK